MGKPVGMEHQMIEVKSGASTTVQWAKLFVFTSNNAAERAQPNKFACWDYKGVIPTDQRVRDANLLARRRCPATENKSADGQPVKAHCPNHCVFLEDVWKTLGRRGHLSQNPLEDTDLEKEYK